MSCFAQILSFKIEHPRGWCFMRMQATLEPRWSLKNCPDSSPAWISLDKKIKNFTEPSKLHLQIVFEVRMYHILKNLFLVHNFINSDSTIGETERGSACWTSSFSNFDRLLTMLNHGRLAGEVVGQIRSFWLLYDCFFSNSFYSENRIRSHVYQLALAVSCFFGAVFVCFHR